MIKEIFAIIFVFFYSIIHSRFGIFFILLSFTILGTLLYYCIKALENLGGNDERYK